LPIDIEPPKKLVSVLNCLIFCIPVADKVPPIVAFALVEIDPVIPKLPVICADPVKGNPTPDPPPIRKEAVNAFCAQEEVPNREPVMPLLTDKLPVIAPEPVIIKEPVITSVSALEENTLDPAFALTEKLPVTPKLPVI